MFPEFLYRLSPRDEQVTPLEIVTFRSSLSANSTNVNSATYTVPKGKILILQAATIEAAPVPALSVVSAVRLDMYTDSSVPVVLTQDKNPYTGEINGPALLRNHVAVPEQWILRGIATYSAANAGNSIIFSMSGILIPRGNFAV